MDFIQVPQSQNSEADEVARQASSEEGTSSPNLKMEVQRYPSIDELHTFAIQNQNGWTTPIITFLRDGHLLANTDEARNVKK